MRLGALVLLMIAACTPPRNDATADAGGAAPGHCTRFGQTCEFSPGKLGSCVQKSDCTGNDCFVCQSQH